MPLYRKILNQAFLVSWQNKYLWFFGLFAALVGSGGYEIVGQSLAANSDNILWAKDFLNTGVISANTFGNIKNLAVSQPKDLLIIGMLLFVFLVVSAFLLWIATVSQTAIVAATKNIAADKDNSFNDNFKEGLNNFWPVFFINVFVKVAIFIVMLIINFPIIFGIFYGGDFSYGSLYVFSVVVFVPILILFSFMMKYVIAYIVVKGDNLSIAIKRGWHLFRANWIISIEAAFILFLISFFISMLAIIILSILILPAKFAFYMAISYFGFYAGLVIMFISELFGFLVIIGFSSFNSVFQISAWTNLFIEISGRGGESKIERILGGALKKRT